MQENLKSALEKKQDLGKLGGDVINVALVCNKVQVLDFQLGQVIAFPVYAGADYIFV